ncbi:MAG: carboxypeptidase regulatory-like domain-containing protein [Bryobacteraceae bacterium]
MRYSLRFILLTLASTALVSAQTALTGSIQGLVRDVQGAAFGRGVSVTLQSRSLSIDQTIQADANGRFRFLRLAPASDYRLAVSAPEFSAWERSDISVLSGEATQIDVTLSLAGRQDLITITETPSVLLTDSPELSRTVDPQRLKTLPTNGRFLNRFALLNAHVRNTGGMGGDGIHNTRLSINGAIFRDTQYRLDGNTNYDTLFNNAPLQRVSLSAVQEFRVLTNQFNAEHGSTSTGLIITTTKTGTDDWHGEALFFGRPSGIQARPPLANRHIPNQLLQHGASLGGPLARQRTYVFANYERLQQDRGSFITSPQPAVYNGSLRDTLGLVRLDHRFSDTHWSTLRINGQRDFNTNPNDRVGGLMQPSTAIRTATHSVGTQWTDTVVRGRLVNELRAGYINSVPSNSTPENSQVGIVRAGYSTEGASTTSRIRAEVFQAADQLSIHAGAHTLKFGGDFIRRKFDDFSYDEFGTYTFPAGPPVPGQQPIQYRQRFGVSRITYGQTQWAGFVQDTWRALPRLTLNLGLRYDFQSILQDRNNFGPRLGFAWDIAGDGSTVVRGGGGLFYDQPFFHGLTQRFLLNGLDVPFATYVLTPGHPAFPAFPNSYAPTAAPDGLPLGPRNVVLPADRLLSPYTSQFTLGIQRRVAGAWVASIDLIRSLSVKQFVHYDRNAPAPFPRTAPGQIRSVAEADRTRPLYDPALGVSMHQGVPIRQLRETTNGGSAHFNAIDLGLSRRFAGRYQFEAHYLLSSALNSVTDDHLGANPNEWSDVGRGERGQSDFSQRHRLVTHGSVLLPWNLQLSGIATIASGLPVNALTGVDNNGDTTVVDRPAGFGRNAFRGTPQKSLDLSVSKPIILSESARLELRADSFNVFNFSNFYRFNSVYGNGPTPNPNFLRPIGGIANVDPGRQFTFGARLAF